MGIDAIVYAEGPVSRADVRRVDTLLREAGFTRFWPSDGPTVEYNGDRLEAWCLGRYFSRDYPRGNWANIRECIKIMDNNLPNIIYYGSDIDGGDSAVPVSGGRNLEKFDTAWELYKDDWA